MPEGPQRWSLDGLERACRRVLLERTSLRVVPLQHAQADVEWTDGGRAKVRVDNHDVGLRSGTLHELIHVVLDDSLAGFDDDLAELVVLTFESRLDRRIALSKWRTAWWRKTINRLAR